MKTLSVRPLVCKYVAQAARICGVGGSFVFQEVQLFGVRLLEVNACNAYVAVLVAECRQAITRQSHERNREKCARGVSLASIAHTADKAYHVVACA